MSFKIIHEGDVILELDQQVVSASLRTSHGSGTPTFLDSDTGVVELVIEKVPTGGPRRLDQIEAQALKDIQDRSTEGETVGMTANTLEGEDAHRLMEGQGVHTETLNKTSTTTEADKGSTVKPGKDTDKKDDGKGVKL